jgi:RHS repeat-associated protein
MNRQDSMMAAVAYNLRFPGQIFDGQAGLHDNGFRAYDPAIGRYPRNDPNGRKQVDTFKRDLAEC